MLGLPGGHQERERGRVVRGLFKRLLLVGALVGLHAVRGRQGIIGRGLVLVRRVRGGLLREQERIDLVLRVW